MVEQKSSSNIAYQSMLEQKLMSSNIACQNALLLTPPPRPPPHRPPPHSSNMCRRSPPHPDTLSCSTVCCLCSTGCCQSFPYAHQFSGRFTLRIILQRGRRHPPHTVSCSTGCCLCSSTGCCQSLPFRPCIFGPFHPAKALALRKTITKAQRQLA